MLFGVQTFPTDYSIGPGEFAALAEGFGFESVFFPEESHIPVGREIGTPVSSALPRAYFRTLDTVVAMTAAAGSTTTIKIGSAVATVAQRDPIQFAKEISSIDHLSVGRVILGIGVGWSAEIMRNHGLDPSLAWHAMREKVLAMSAMWSEEEASYRGEIVSLDPIYMWPKPRQHPRPPILVGGYGPRVLERVLEYGDGWMPFRVEPDDPRAGSNEPEEFDADLARRIADLHRRGDACGRGRLPVTLFNAKPQRDALRRYDDIGVARCIFHLPSVGPGEMEQQLASLADVAGLK